MRLTVNSTLRRDGKYKVTVAYDGSPNAFGGFYPGKRFNKLYTAAQIKEYIDKFPDATFTGVPAEVLNL